MCDARARQGEEQIWASVMACPDFERLLRDTLDNLVDLPERDGEFVRRQLVAFSNCVRQLVVKEVLFNVAEGLTNNALMREQWTLKRMLREILIKEGETRCKTFGGSTTSDGSPKDSNAF